MSANPDCLRPILPFRLRPYKIMLALSVGLFIIIPLLACIVYCVLWLLGVFIGFLSWSLGLILSATAIVLVIRYNESHYNDVEIQNVIIPGLIAAAIITCYTYTPLNTASETLLALTTITWDYLITVYSSIWIVYWSWIPIFSMLLYGTVSLLALCLMKILDWRPHWGQIRFICPHENCGSVSSSLVYKCPHCGGELTNLHPSRFGIFATNCPHCHNAVMTSWLTGRNKYSKTCPNCHKSLDFEGFGDVPESVFIVEGASKSGKTSFLFQALNLWNNHFKSYIQFSDNEQERQIRLQAEQISKGYFCPQTPRQTCPESYVMLCKKSFGKFLAYFYDTGGIASIHLEAGMPEPYFNLANGIFLVIDPWGDKGLFSLADNYKKTYPSDFQYATQDANAVVGILCNKLEHIYEDPTNSGFDIPICVVVTKCDINRLDESIGIAANYSQSSKQWAEQSQKVENFLINNGMYNFVNVIKTRFKKKAFFAVSVLDSSTHHPEAVLNPLLWMTCNAL